MWIPHQSMGACSLALKILVCRQGVINDQIFHLNNKLPSSKASLKIGSALAYFCFVYSTVLERHVVSLIICHKYNWFHPVRLYASFSLVFCACTLSCIFVVVSLCFRLQNTTSYSCWKVSVEAFNYPRNYVMKQPIEVIISLVELILPSKGKHFATLLVTDGQREFVCGGF